MGRGGGVRTAVQVIDEDALADSLLKHVEDMGVKDALNFSSYELIGKSHAVVAAGLAKNHCILKALLSVAPACEIKMSTLCKMMKRLLGEYPKLKLHSRDKSYSDELWCGRRSDILCTMLAHLRRVHLSSLKYKEMKSKANVEHMEIVNCLLGMIVCSKAAEGILSSPSHSTGKSPEKPAVEEPEEVPTVAKCSLGFPSLLDSPVSHKARKLSGPAAPGVEASAKIQEKDRELKVKLAMVSKKGKKAKVIKKVSKKGKKAKVIEPKALKKPASTGCVKSESMAGGWVKHTFVRASGKQAGHTYFEYVSPEGSRSRSFSDACAKGYKDERA